MNENENKKIEFETSKLVIAIYNKIVLWNNNDYDTDRQKSDALKIVSQDIIQTTLEDLLVGIGVKTNTEITRGNTKVGDTQAIKDVESFTNVNDKDIFNKLFNKV